MAKQKISVLNISMTSGGAEKVISLLLKKLVDDFEVTLILMYDHIHFDIPEGVDIEILSKKTEEKQASFFKQLGDSILFLRKYFKVIRSREIDIAISFLAFPNFLNSLAAMRFSKLKTIVSERGYPSDNTTSRLSYYISKIFYPLLYNRNTRLFSNSIYINQDLADNFRVKIPMEVIYNPIEMPESQVAPDSLGIATDKLRTVTAGTLNERKNQAIIIKAIAEAAEGLELDIYGNGPLRSQLEELIAEKGLGDSVFLKGRVKKVSERLVQYNCFVLSSNTEGFPNALLEAMAVGLPCISTNCLSGPLELLNGSADEIFIEKGSFYKGKNGLLINNGDHLGLHKALLYFKEHPGERVKFGARASAKAAEFELGTVYDQFKNFIIS
ncbi:glycosyltransferase [Poritiphilus flavus]|uniref:Glycosyltransferase n=1 Tax=Poritiphilus flavus TaxID=2697053 RepID=A0A6L9ECJ2_9FLAO|nr:glycosyltransferase [Poritiphilus flavus]NAS12362.1 glycosyltransferase [Poritiphilus flavus]